MCVHPVCVLHFHEMDNQATSELERLVPAICELNVLRVHNRFFDNLLTLGLSMLTKAFHCMQQNNFFPAHLVA